MVEGELLSVVEEDKGDGWTRVRRNLEEEGYVPTSYIKVFLDSSAKGNDWLTIYIQFQQMCKGKHNLSFLSLTEACF